MDLVQQQCAALWGRLGGWARRGAAAVLAGGPVPRHVAFIMVSCGARLFCAWQHCNVEGMPDSSAS